MNIFRKDSNSFNITLHISRIPDLTRWNNNRYYLENNAQDIAMVTAIEEYMLFLLNKRI